MASGESASLGNRFHAALRVQAFLLCLTSFFWRTASAQPVSTAAEPAFSLAERMLGAGCESISYDEILANSQDPLIGRFGVPEVRKVSLCTALAKRDMKICAAPPSATAEEQTLAGVCEDQYFFLGAPVPALAGPLLDRCVRSTAKDQTVRRGAEREACSLYFSAFAQVKPEAVCDKLAKLQNSAKGTATQFVADCRQELGGAADAKSCLNNPRYAKDEPPSEAVVCPDRARVIEAVGKGAAACGDSALCRAAVTGSAAACEDLKKKIGPALCGKRQEILLWGEKAFRKTYSLPQYKPGDKPLFPVYLREEARFRAYYRFAPYKAGDRLLCMDKRADEDRFRGQYEIGPHKPGEPFLQLLLPREEAAYRSMRRLPEYKSGDPLYHVIRSMIISGGMPTYGQPQLDWKRVHYALMLHNEKRYRQPNSLPPYREGDPFLHVSALKEEMRLRSLYKMPEYVEGGEFLATAMVKSEIEFRRVKRLVPFKVGDPLLKNQPPHVLKHYRRPSSTSSSQPQPQKKTQ